MTSELHNLPPWNVESREKVIQQLREEVKRSTREGKPPVQAPIVRFHSHLGDPKPIYRDLATSKAAFRVLKLALTEDDGPIICALESVSLDDNPEYAALSYEWGEALNTEEIIVNGSPFVARPNLSDALRQLRKIARSTSDQSFPAAICLWIDAICINQNDIPERNSQVKLMQSIYRKATTVLSWMGVKEETELAITTLRGLVANLELAEKAEKEMTTITLHGQRDSMWLIFMKSLCSSQYFVSSSNSDNGKRSTGNYIWDALTLFANHSYWFRTWIVQEVILGHDVLLFAGDEVINLDRLDIFTKKLCDLLEHSRPCPSIVQPQIWSIISANYHAWKPLRQTADMRWQYQHGKLDNMGLEIVIVTRVQRATDPRDKVFGLLGVTKVGIVADYTRTTESVYFEFASKWVQSENPIEHLLIYSGCGIHASNRLALPTWMPDWRLVGTLSNFNPMGYNAGGSHAYFKTLPYLVGPFLRNNVLQTCGAIVSSVQFTSSVMGLGEAGSHRHFEFGTSYLARQNLPMYATGIPYLQAFFRVSMRDQDHLQDKTALLSTSPTFFSLAMGEDLEKTAAVCLPKLGLSAGPNFAPSFSKSFLGGLSPYVDAWKSAEDAMLDDDYWNGTIAVMTILNVENSDKRFFETSDGLLGLGPRGMQNGDCVAVLSGCSMPVVLRKIGSYYLHVGSCFVLGLMNGEAQRLGPGGHLDKFTMLDIH